MGHPSNIAILGGGLIGLCCADSLAARGAKVTIFERGSKVGQGAARFNSGMIHPSQAAPWLDNPDTKTIEAVLSLARRSKDLLQQRREALGCHDISRPSGIIQIFDSLYAGQQSRAFYQALNIEAEPVSNAFTFQRYGLKLSGDESGNAAHFMKLLAEDLLGRGVQFCTDVAAMPARNDNQTGILLDGNFTAYDHVIIAAGAHSADILAPLGIKLSISAQTGHALSFDRPDMELPSVPILHWDSRSALTVFEDEVRLSGTQGEDSPEALLEIWEEIAPDIIEALGPPKRQWSADRPFSALGRPIISSASTPGLWVNSGHGHMGWTLCAASGELMAEMIMDGARAPEFGLG